jgi:hypothetical protein
MTAGSDALTYAHTWLARWQEKRMGVMKLANARGTPTTAL